MLAGHEWHCNEYKMKLVVVQGITMEVFEAKIQI